MKKAIKFNQIDDAIMFDLPVGPDEEYFTDFKQVRGSFYEELLFKSLGVSIDNNEPNLYTDINKKIIFISGHRGSGKTSEIKKWVNELNGENGFLCITCNINKDLDMNNIEFIDILILKLEMLIAKLNSLELKIDDDILKTMYNWFSERIDEISEKSNGEIQIEGGAEGSAGLFGFFKVFASLKSSITDSNEKAEIIRTTFRNRFNDFSNKFNLFIAEVNSKLVEYKIAKKVLFFIDGLEQTLTSELRRKIIIDESNRLKLITTFSIYTLPIELMREENMLRTFSHIISFPFIKIYERDGQRIEQAFLVLREFILKRIDISLFDNNETIEKIIHYSGGSPRELLRILQYCKIFTDPDIEILTLKSLENGVKKLAAEESRFVSEKDLIILKQIKESNKNGIPVPFLDGLQVLLENLIVFEYNSGTYKAVNPIIAESEVYKYFTK
jgi:hypothetical protein